MMRYLILLIFLAACSTPTALEEARDTTEVESKNNACPRYHIDLEDGTSVFYQPEECEEKPVLIQ